MTLRRPGAPLPAPCTGSGGSETTAHSVANRKIVSIPYSQAKPSTGISAPPTSGPAMAPADITVMPSALAAAS